MYRPSVFENMIPTHKRKHQLTSSTRQSAIVLVKQFRNGVVPGQANDVVAVDVCVEVTHGMNAEGQAKKVMDSIHYRPMSQPWHPLIIYILTIQRTEYA